MGSAGSDEFGDPFHPARLTRTSTRCSAALVCQKFPCHDPRYTAVIIALLAGLHPKVVSERHGHASPQITLDRYGHVLDSMPVDAADAIGRLFNGSSSVRRSGSLRCVSYAHAKGEHHDAR
jgi:integrase